ncbi:MAG: porin family protein [Calditrichaceae bacterium]
MSKIGRPIIFIAIILLLAGISNAQSYKKGLSFGLNSTYYEYDRTPEYWNKSNRNLFNASIFLEFLINSKLSVRPSLRFAQLGNHVDFDDEISPILTVKSFEITQTYLTIPLDFKYLILQQPGIYLLSGIEVGYLIKTDAKTFFIDNSEKDEDITSNINRVNFNVSIGAGFELKQINEKIVFFELKYSYGITEVSKESEWLYNWKTRELCFNVGLKF